MLQLSLPDLNANIVPSNRTKHERLRDHLVTEMQEGRLKPGALLPSEQNLAESLGVARNTVRQAMASLEQDGFVQRVHGKGTFVHEHVKEKFRTNSTGLFAVIVPETQRGFYPNLLKSFSTAAEGIHHQVIVCNTDNQVDRQGNAILQLIDREVAGVVIVPTTTPATPLFQVAQLQKRNIPVVFCSRRVEGSRAPLLGIPFEQVGVLAAESILSQGHREIALFFTHPSEATLGYEAGFRKAIQRHAGTGPVGLKVYMADRSSPDVTFYEDWVNTSLEMAVFQTKTPATAIFTGFDSFTEAVYLKLVRTGYRVPEDISLVGFGASQRTTALQNQLTSVTIDEVLMGQQALNYLDRMRRKEIPLESPDVILAKIALHQGQTLGPPPGVSKASSLSHGEFFPKIS